MSVIARLPQPVRCRKCRGTFGSIFEIRFHKGRHYHRACAPKGPRRAPANDQRPKT